MKTSKTNNWVLLKKEAFVKEEPETLSQSQAELAAAEPTKKKNSNLQLCLQLWPVYHSPAILSLEFHAKMSQSKAEKEISFGSEKERAVSVSSNGGGMEASGPQSRGKPLELGRAEEKKKTMRVLGLDQCKLQSSFVM